MAEVTTKMGLAAWDQPLDPYNYQQFANNWNIIDFHDHTPGRGVPIPLGGIAPGAISKTQLTPDVLGSRGTLTLSGAQSVSSASYVTMPTPDQITGIILPTSGLIAVWYQATWQESVANAAGAELFLNANAVQRANATTTGTGVALASIGGTIGQNVPLVSYWGGLASMNSTAPGYNGDQLQGQIVGLASGGNGVGGPCYIFANPGTYTVSVRFSASSGTVTASNRKLWVQVLFG